MMNDDTSIPIMEVAQVANRCMEEVDIQLLPSSDPSTIASTVQNMSSLKSVDISSLNAREGQLTWNTPAVQTFFETLGALPKLRKIQFKFLGGGDLDNAIPLRLFTSLLQQSAAAKSLESFRLVLVGPITCTIEEAREFSQALRRQVNLRDFRMSSCYLAHEMLTAAATTTTDANFIMDPILQALATLPSLQTVSMKAASKGHLGNVNSESIGALCRSVTVKDVSLDNLVLLNSHISAVSQALSLPNAILEDLYLNLTSELKINTTMLPEVLRHNKSLKKLQMRLSNQTDINNFLFNMATALKHNTTLKEFGVFGSIKMKDQVEEAFVEMLESNCILEALVMPSNHAGNRREKIDFLLYLNGRGRERLLRQSESINQDEWITLFANARHDINFVYYYLRIDPSLCHKLMA